MTKNSNYFTLFCFWRGRTGQARVTGQGEGIGGAVGAILFICDTLYLPNIRCYRFLSKYMHFIRLPGYGLHKNSLRILSKGCDSKE